MSLSFFCFRLLPSISEIRGPHYKALVLSTAWVWSRHSIGKEWWLIHSRDLLLSFALLVFSRKDPTNHALVPSEHPLQSYRTKTSVWLWDIPRSTWTQVCLGGCQLSTSGIHSPIPKSHPDGTACTPDWAQWCGPGRMGRDSLVAGRRLGQCQILQ